MIFELAAGRQAILRENKWMLAAAAVAAAEATADEAARAIRAQAN